MVRCSTERVILAASLGAKDCQYHIGKAFARHGSSDVAKPGAGVALDRQGFVEGSGDVRHNSWVQPPHVDQHSPFRRTSHRFVEPIQSGRSLLSAAHAAGLPVPWSDWHASRPRPWV